MSLIKNKDEITISEYIIIYLKQYLWKQNGPIYRRMWLANTSQELENLKSPITMYF